MSEIYFPSCNFDAMCPETGRRIREYLSRRMPAAGCCRFDKNDYGSEDVGIYLCQACRQVLEPKIRLESLWTYIDRDDSFPFPDCSGLTVVIQDCWRDRDQPEIHRAVRSLLDKLHVRYSDLPGEAREKASFCGDLHFEPKDPALVELAKELGQYAPPQQPPRELIARLMGEQAAKFGGGTALTYCNRCTRTLRAGGAGAVHIAELLFGTAETV